LLAMALVDLFGDSLLTPGGAQPTADALAGKTTIGIYFSAHWCPPCRGFTPKLAQMYKDVFEAKGMAIVFASSDRDEAAFKEYFGEMPWFALPFENRAAKDKLSKKYKVQGIPSFVIIDPQGNTITTDGRSAVMEDPTGEKYPWIPPTAEEKAQEVVNAIGPDLVGQAGGKPIGLYFSAHWCPPCRGFTPKLAEYYKNGLKDKMEIIFVSSDRDEESFGEYFKEMPWKALPFANRDAKEKLSKAMGVNGIPCFAVINPDGTVVTTDGRSKVEKDPKGDNFPAAWLPQPFNDVNDDPSPMNEEKCVIAMGSNAAMVEAVRTVASEYHEAAGRNIDDMTMRFFEAPAGSVTDQIRKLTKVDGEKLVVLDIPAGGKYYICDGAAADVAAVKAFLADVESGKATQQQLG